jgi:hypothetical protein
VSGSAIKDAGSGAVRLGELLRHGIAVLWSPGSGTGDGGINDFLSGTSPGLRLTVIEINTSATSPAALRSSLRETFLLTPSKG